MGLCLSKSSSDGSDLFYSMSKFTIQTSCVTVPMWNVGCLDKDFCHRHVYSDANKSNYMQLCPFKHEYG